MLKLSCWLVGAFLIILISANVRVEFPEAFIAGGLLVFCCVGAVLMVIVSLCELVSSLGEKKDNFSSRGGFDRFEREMYRNIQFTRRSERFGIHRHIWM